MKKQYDKACATGAKYVSIDLLLEIMEEGLAGGQTVEIMPRGISMRPFIREGRDSVILTASGKENLKKHDVALYRRADGSVVLHRVARVTDLGYTMIGDAQFVYENGVSAEAVIAKVVATRRAGRVISENSSLHRCAVALWYGIRPVRKFFRRVRRRIKSILKRIF